MATFFKKYKLLIAALAISLGTYFLSYAPVFAPDAIFTGEDPQNWYMPLRFYIWDNLHNAGGLSIWTEKIFSGYPIGAEPESGVLNIFNVLLVYTFGPLASYKIEHLLLYLWGSISLFIFLKRKNVNLLGFLFANYAYFFNHFILYHQQHFNIVLTMYTLPAIILLVDNYIRKPSYLRIFLFSLALSFAGYFGHYQSILLIIGTSMLYAGVQLKRPNLKSTALFAVVSMLIYFVLSLPLFISTYQLYSLSSRSASDDGTAYWLQGSYRPGMIVNSFYPSFWGRGGGYAGSGVESDYKEHEVYNYAGIPIFIIAVVSSFLVWKDRRLKIFSFLLCATYFLLGFAKSIPFLETTPIPMLSSFRYWGRSAELFNFGIAIMASMFFTPHKKVFSKKSAIAGLTFWILTAAYFKTLSYFYADRFSMFYGLKKIIYSAVTFTLWDRWLILAAVTFLIIILSFKNTFKSFCYIALVVLLAVDFKLNTFSISKKLFTDWMPQTTQADRNFEKYSGRRVYMANNPKFYANKPLLYNPWGVYGYSQLVPANYANYLDDLGLGSSRGNNLKNVNSYEKLGVESIVDPSGIVTQQFHNKDLIKQDTGFTYVAETMRQGNYAYLINSDSATKIYTFVKYTPYWKVLVNSKPVKYESYGSRGVFLTFDVPKGNSKVNIKYVPSNIYFGLTVSSLFVFGHTAFFGFKLFKIQQKYKKQNKLQ